MGGGETSFSGVIEVKYSKQAPDSIWFCKIMLSICSQRIAPLGTFFTISDWQFWHFRLVADTTSNNHLVL